MYLYINLLLNCFFLLIFLPALLWILLLVFLSRHFPNLAATHSQPWGPLWATWRIPCTTLPTSKFSKVQCTRVHAQVAEIGASKTAWQLDSDFVRNEQQSAIGVLILWSFRPSLQCLWAAQGNKKTQKIPCTSPLSFLGCHGNLRLSILKFTWTIYM